MEKLGKTKEQYNGDFVLNTQVVAKEEGFKHVNKGWLSSCPTIDQGLNDIAKMAEAREDISATVKQMVPTVDDHGDLVFEHEDGRVFVPTMHALEQVSNWANIGRYFPRAIYSENPERDTNDANTLCMAIRNGFRRLKDKNEGAKEFVWRTYKDGTLRAMLTPKYAIINNEWFLECMKRIVPDGRLSHWERSDADTVWGNILIPDYVREETDSDFGGGLSVGNSEIGVRRLSMLPFVFRAICCNGNIWDRQDGTAMRRVHLGKINLTELATLMHETVQKQIPLINTFMDSVLELRKFETKVPMKNVIAQVSKDFKLTKKQALSTLEAYLVEPDKSAYGVMNAVTRAAQTHDTATWDKMNIIGGTLSTHDEDWWTRLFAKSETVDLETVFG